MWMDGWGINERSSMGASRYDVRIGEGRGGHGKADVVREVACILQYKSVPNEDKGEGVKKSKHFVDIISGRPIF